MFHEASLLMQVYLVCLFGFHINKSLIANEKNNLLIFLFCMKGSQSGPVTWLFFTLRKQFVLAVSRAMKFVPDKRDFFYCE